LLLLILGRLSDVLAEGEKRYAAHLAADPQILRGTDSPEILAGSFVRQEYGRGRWFLLVRHVEVPEWWATLEFC
jgi:hypothetical protein